MSTPDRLHALDAVRAFALLLGIAFHAAISFIPGMPPVVWAIADNSPSSGLAAAAFVAHIFRMSLFFFIAGFFARLLLQRRGTRGFWTNRLKRILVPLLVGWLVLFPAIGLVWYWGILETFGNAIPPRPQNMPAAPAGAFPLTHLWFLYQLLLIYAAVLLVRRAVIALDGAGHIRAFADRVVRGSLKGYWAALLLGLPVAACLYSLNTMWVFFQGIPTPDSSLIPQLASSVGFGTAFVFGWLIHRQLALLSQLQRRWVGHLVLAVAATAACLWIIGSRPVLTPVPPGNERIAFVLAFSVALWSWVLAITGIGLRFFSEASARVRYVADSSYWLYLAHLPIVAAFQVLVAKWPLHWSVKYPLVLAASFAILFASYHFLVRPTWLGEFLNGRKYPRRSPPPVRETDTRAPAATGGPVAELVHATKRYGKTVALDDVDLQVNRGELLAVLGPNGAGKSTAIGLWLGLIQPDSGTATLGGGSPLDVDHRRKLGVMMQEVELPRELRVRELIALTTSYYVDPLTPQQAMELTRTTPLAERLYGKLSGGQKRQVQFALAVCGRPDLLFLDEPTVGLDVQAREAMWATINELIHQGCSIVLTTHYLEEAEALADRVVVLAKSRVIASGTVEEMRSVVSCKQITCRSDLSADEIRAWPGVVEVIHDTNRLRITAKDAEDVVRRLLASDPALRNLEVRQAGLSEAFTQLTQEAA
jgi:ABC-type multidrug transport system ATPase subunit/peptidoglycan/LPS O-acetylase OafA/YrhL